AFEISAEIPERQRGIDLALQRFLRQEWRRAVDDSCLFFEIQSGLARQRLQQQPAFVERTAGHSKLLAPEIGDLTNRGLRRDHHRAERARRGIKYKIVAERTLARDP